MHEEAAVEIGQLRYEIQDFGTFDKLPNRADKRSCDAADDEL